jgi:OFA family oxalate/formate antiporter-like MFS transporter
LDAVRQSDQRPIRLGRAAIQVAFTIFVVVETWIVPVVGYLIDRFGPRMLMLGGGVLVGVSWVMNAAADSLALLYTAATIGGLGAGIVYGATVGNALKWFPDRRGPRRGADRRGFRRGLGADGGAHRRPYRRTRL